MTKIIELINNSLFLQIIAFFGSIISVSIAMFKLFLEGKIKSQQKQIDDLKNLNLTEQHQVYKNILSVLNHRIHRFSLQLKKEELNKSISNQYDLVEAELKKQMIIFAHPEILDLYIKQEKLYINNDKRFFRYFFDMILLIRQRLFEENQINSIVIASIFFKGENLIFYKQIGFSDKDIILLKDNTSQLKLKSHKSNNLLKSK